MESMNLKIGEKLKSLRTTRTMSLDDVSALTGVSKPMLGQIERGQSIPTVTTLWKIATGLKTPLSFFLEGPQAEYSIDNPKYKAQFGTKAKMLTPDEAETLIDHAVGGVCPFGINEGVTVYLDNSLKRFETVFPACGSSNSAIELSIEELEKYSGYAAWIDVCKGWSE